MKKQIFLLGSILALCGCSKSIEHHYFSYGYFDTYVDIKLFEGEEQNLQELQAILSKYSKNVITTFRNLRQLQVK